MSGASETIDAAGVRLHVETIGSGRPVVLLHGFTGCAESMRPAVGELPDWRCLSVDLVGHGASETPSDPGAYQMRACVAQLLALLPQTVGTERPHLLGYSMGGRVALSVAAAAPGRIASLVLVGASAGLETSPARRERVAADEALAARVLSGGIEAFVDHWMALPLFASQARLGRVTLEAARTQRLRCNPSGLALSLRGLGTGAQPPLRAALPSIDTPTLLVFGEEDTKFAAIARALGAALPNAGLAEIPCAGHAAHLENPLAFGKRVRGFLRRVERRERTTTIRRTDMETA